MAVDNSVGYLPSITPVPALQSPAVLGLGVTRITYVAEDRAGNTAQCVMTVTVVGEYPGTFIFCHSDNANF